jgi:hypothetical protein
MKLENPISAAKSPGPAQDRQRIGKQRPLGRGRPLTYPPTGRRHWPKRACQFEIPAEMPAGARGGPPAAAFLSVSVDLDQRRDIRIWIDVSSPGYSPRATLRDRGAWTTSRLGAQRPQAEAVPFALEHILPPIFFIRVGARTAPPQEIGWSTPVATPHPRPARQ